MVTLTRVLALLALSASVAAVPAPAPQSASSGVAPASTGLAAWPAVPSLSIAERIMNNSQTEYQKNTREVIASQNGTCTLDKVVVRQAWDDMDIDERDSYMQAYKCMLATPAKTPKDWCPGCRNAVDDFIYAHINQTNFIHLSALLLPWHRQFIWAFEQALRSQCGYTGGLPYWAWDRHSANQSLSPVFAPEWFGGNGVYVPHGEINGSTVGLDPPYTVPNLAGTGGGCVVDGQFANLTVHLGPVDPANNPPDNLYGTQYNPRCLRRDFYQDYSTYNLTAETVALVWELDTIYDFNPLLQETVHTLSHNFIGGDTIDFYTSVNEPVFWLLHGQVDRVWTVWQGLDYSTRSTALQGTVTLANIPPSENATLSTIMHMGLPAGGDMTVERAMLTFENDYCYMYA